MAAGSPQCSGCTEDRSQPSDHPAGPSNRITRRLERRGIALFAILTGLIVFAYGGLQPNLGGPDQHQTAFLGLATITGVVAGASVGSLGPAIQDVRKTLRRRDREQSDLVARLEQRADRLQDYSQRLKQRNEDLHRFTYVLAHDLREPARTVATHARLVQRQVGEDLAEQPRGDLEATAEAAKRLDRLLADLLTYTELEQRERRVEAVELEEVVSRALARLSGQVQDQEAVIEVDELPEVLGDGVELVRLFEHLVDNAIKFAPEDRRPRIEIRAKPWGDRWRIEVEDEGIGMDPDHADRVFSIFERLHDWNEYEGTGVGLALCQRIAERHGGSIEVETEPGEGSTFQFTLPRPQGREPAREGTSKSKPRFQELV